MLGKQNRIIGIDLLRSLCILYIAGFWHLLDYTEAVPGYQNLITFRISEIVLGTFVYISGYFIGLNYSHISRREIIDFYKKRFLRLYPLYLLALGLFSIFNLTIITLVKSVILVSMFIKPAAMTLWFVTMLLLFYLISPFLIMLCRNSGLIRVMLYCSLLVAALLLYDNLTGLLDLRIIMYFPAFLLGIHVSSSRRKLSLSENLAIYSCTAFLIITGVMPAENTLKSILSIPFIVSCSYILFRSFSKFDVTSARAIQIISTFSYASYCIYLLHRPIYEIFKSLYFPEIESVQLAYLIVICLPVIVISSYVVQRLYDSLILMIRAAGEKNRSVDALEKPC